MNKKEVIKFRCTPLEKAIIFKKAEHSGQSVSAYCRATALNQKVSYKLTESELNAYQTLTQFHNNFKAISNLLKKKDSNFAKEVKQTADEIKKHLNKFK